MRQLITFFLLFAFFTMQADITYTLFWLGSSGNNAVGTLVIDETVCLQAGTCPETADVFSTFGAISYDLTIDGGCAAGTYTASDFTDIVVTTSGVPDLTTDLQPQSSDINFFSTNDNLNGVFFYEFGDCEFFSLQAAIPEVAPAAVPTLGEWGLIIFTLLLLNMGISLMLSREGEVALA